MYISQRVPSILVCGVTVRRLRGPMLFAPRPCSNKWPFKRWHSKNLKEQSPQSLPPSSNANKWITFKMRFEQNHPIGFQGRDCSSFISIQYVRMCVNIRLRQASSCWCPGSSWNTKSCSRQNAFSLFQGQNIVSPCFTLDKWFSRVCTSSSTLRQRIRWNQLFLFFVYCWLSSFF